MGSLKRSVHTETDPDSTRGINKKEKKKTKPIHLVIYFFPPSLVEYQFLSAVVRPSFSKNL